MKQECFNRTVARFWEDFLCRSILFNSSRICFKLFVYQGKFLSPENVFDIG